MEQRKNELASRIEYALARLAEWDKREQVAHNATVQLINDTRFALEQLAVGYIEATSVQSEAADGH